MSLSQREKNRFCPHPGLLRLSALLVFSVGLGACIVVPAEVPIQFGAAGLRALDSNLVLPVGGERDLLPFIREHDTGQIPTTGVVWHVSNPALLQIDPTTGRAKALGKGDVVVTASRGEAAGAPPAQLIISIVDEETALVKEVSVAPENKRMHLGENIILQASVRMADGQLNGNVIWSSSDSTVAAVNPSTGEVRALRAGKVTIVAAYAADPRYKALAELNIGEPVIEATPRALPSPSDVPTREPQRKEPEPPPASLNRPSPSPSQVPLVLPAAADTAASSPVSPSPVVSIVPTPRPTRSYGLGMYAVIHPDDGHVCGGYVGNGHWHNTRPPLTVGDCPSGSLHVFQAGPDHTGNVAGWHGPNVFYKDGVFTILDNDGKVVMTIVDGIVTDQNGYRYDAGTREPVTD